MQQTEARTARPAASFATAAAIHGYTSSSPGVFKSPRLHDAANIAAQKRASTALEVAELRERFRKHCHDSETSAKQSAEATSSRVKKFAERDSTVAVATPPPEANTKGRGLDCEALCKSPLISTYSPEFSRFSPENKAFQDTNRSTCFGAEDATHKRANHSTATSSVANENRGVNELGLQRRPEEPVGKYRRQHFPLSPSWSTLTNTCSTKTKVAYSSPVRCTDATKSVAAADDFSVNATVNEKALAITGVRTASAGCPVTTGIQWKADVCGKEAAARGVKQPGVVHVCTLPDIYNEHSGSVTRRESGGSSASVKLMVPPVATSPQDSRKPSAKPSAALQTRHGFKYPPDEQRHQRSYGRGETVDFTLEQSDDAKALPAEPLHTMKRSSYNTSEPQAHAAAVSSADSHRCRHGVTQNEQLSSENIYLFSPLYSKSPLLEDALQKSQQELLQTCNLQQREHTQVRQLLSQAQQRRNSRFQQQPPNSKDLEKKSNASPAEPTADSSIKQTANSAPAEKPAEGDSSCASPVSVSPSSTSRPSSVFSSALSSPAANIGGKNNRGLLAQSTASTAEEVLTASLRQKGTGSPSLKGMAQNLNSIRDGLLRAVEETRQSFVKLRLPPDRWTDRIKPVKKKSATYGHTCVYSSGRSKGIQSKSVRNNLSVESRYSGRRKNRSDLDSAADNSGVSGCTNACHSLKRSHHTSSNCKDKRYAHCGRHRFLEQNCARSLYQCGNQRSGGPDAEVETHFKGVDRAPLEELQQEQPQQRYQQLPQGQRVTEVHLRKQQKKRKQHHKCTWEDQPQRQPRQLQQRQAHHQLPQQPATGSLVQSCEERADDVTCTTKDCNEATVLPPLPQCHEQYEITQRPQISAEEPSDGRMSVQRHLPELHHQHQSLEQLHHTQPSGRICRVMNPQCRSSSTGRGFTCSTSENVSSDGSSRIAVQNSMPVSSVGTADALNVFVTPQTSHLTSPQTPPQDPREINCKTVCTPQQLSPSYALLHAAVDATPSDVPLDAGAAAAAAPSAFRTPSEHVVPPGFCDPRPSSPAGCSSASVLHAQISHRWANIMPCSGQAQKVLISDSETQQLRSPDGVLPHPTAQQHTYVQPKQNLPVGEAEDGNLSGQKGKRRTKEQGTWSKWARLSPRQQSSPQWAPFRTSAHASSNVFAAPYVSSPPYREQESSYRKTERGSEFVAAKGPVASCSEESCPPPQLITQQQRVPAGLRNNLQIHSAAAKCYCSASGSPQPSRKKSAGAMVDGFGVSEKNAPRQVLPQCAGPRDSLQLSPSSCWDVHSSRSRESASSSNHSSRPQSGSTAGRAASEERPGRRSVRLKHNRMHSHTSDTQKQKQPHEQHTAQQAVAITPQHQQPAHVKYRERFLQSEKIMRQHNGLQKQTQHLLNEARRQPERRKWHEQGKDGCEDYSKLLENGSSGIASRQVLQQHSRLLRNLTDGQQLGQPQLLQKQQQQQRGQPLHTEQQYGPDEGEDAARQSVVKPSTQCMSTQEMTVRADPQWTQETENRVCESIQASSTSGSDGCEGQKDLPLQKSSVLLRPPSEHAGKSISATAKCGVPSERPAQALSTVTGAPLAQSFTHALAVVDAATFVRSNNTSPHAAQLTRNTGAPAGSPFVAGSACVAANTDSADDAGALVRAAVSAAAVADCEIDGASKQRIVQYLVPCRIPRQPANSRVDVEFQQRQLRCPPQQQSLDQLQTLLYQYPCSHERGTQYSQMTTDNGDKSLDNFSAPSVVDRRPECLCVATAATGASLLNKPDTKGFTLFSATDDSAKPTSITVPYSPSQGGRTTHAATAEVVSIGVAVRAVAGGKSFDYVSSVREPTGSTVTTLSAPAIQDDHRYPLRDQHPQSQGVQQMQWIEPHQQQEHPEAPFHRLRGKQQGRTHPHAHQQTRQIGEASSPVRVTFTPTATATSAATAAPEQAHCTYQHASTYSPRRIIVNGAPVATDVGGCKNRSDRVNVDSGITGNSRSSTAACYSEGGSRCTNISERCTEGSSSSACENNTNDAAYSHCRANSSNRDNDSTADARCYIDQSSRSIVDPVTTLSPAVHAGNRNGEFDSHQAQQQGKQEGQQVPYGHNYLPDHEVSHDWKKQHGHTQEKLTALHLHKYNLQLDHTVYNQVITPTQRQRLLHTVPAEQQPPRPVARHQSPTTSPNHLPVEVTGSAPQENTCSFKERLQQDAQAAYALQPRKARRTYNNAKMQQGGRPSFSPNCPRQRTVTSVLSPKSRLQEQYMLSRGKGISQHGRQGEEGIQEYRQDGLLASQRASEHERSESAFPLPSVCTGHSNRPAQKLQSRDDICSKPEQSREVKDTTNSTVLHSGVIDNKTYNAGPNAGEILIHNSCLRNSASHVTRCTRYIGPAGKVCGAHEGHAMACATFDASRNRMAKNVTSQRVEPASRGGTAASPAVAIAAATSDDDSSVSAECWSYRPACGSSRRSSLRSGSECSSQHQSPHVNDAYRPARRENICGTAASLRVSAISSAKEKHQNVKQFQVQCHQHSEGMQKNQQTPKETLESLHLCRESQQTPPLQIVSGGEIEQPVTFFSPQEAVGSSTEYAGSRYLTSPSADASMEGPVADAAASQPVGLCNFSASPCEDECSVCLTGHLAAKQQQSHEQDGPLQHEECSQQQHLRQQIQRRESPLEEGNREVVKLCGRVPSQEEADGDKQKAMGAFGKGTGAPRVSPVCSSTLLHNECLAIEDCNLKEASSSSSTFKLDFRSIDNCRAKQQLDDLLDVVQLLLSAVEGNADDLRHQLTRQQLFPHPALAQRRLQAGGARTPLEQNLQEDNDKEDHQTHSDCVQNGYTRGNHYVLKEDWLREVQEQVRQPVLLSTQQHLTQPTKNQDKCANLPRAQTSCPKVAMLGQLLGEKESLLSQPQQQHERGLDQQETQAVLDVQPQQESHGPVGRTASGIPAPAGLPAADGEPAAEKHQVTSGGVPSLWLPPSSRRNSLDAASFDVSASASESRTNREQEARLYSPCHERTWSSHTNGHRDQKVFSYTILATCVSSDTRSLVTPAFGCNPAEEKAIHETRAAVAKATAAAERASAAAAQAAAAAQTSGRVAYASAVGTALPQDIRAGTEAAPGSTTSEVGRQEGTTGEQEAAGKSFRANAAAPNRVGAGILALATAQVASPLTCKPDAKQSSYRNEELKWEISPQKRQGAQGSFQHRSENKVEHLHAEQMQLRPPQLCSVRSQMGQFTRAIPVQHEEQCKPDSLMLAGSPIAERQEKQHQQKQHQQYLKPIEIGEGTNDANNGPPQGLLESGSHKSVRNWPVLLPHLSEGDRILPEQRLCEQHKVPVRRQQQSAVHNQLDGLTNGKLPSRMQWQQPPLTLRSPRLEQLLLKEKTPVLQHDQVAPTEGLQEILRYEAPKDARQPPQQREQPPLQHKQETMVSHGDLQQSLGVVSTESQAMQVKVTLLQSETDPQKRDLLSVCSLTSMESNVPLLASIASALRHTGASPGAVKSWDHLRVQQQCMPPHYQGFQVQENDSQSSQAQDPTLPYSRQQHLTQWDEPQQQCQAQDSFLPQSPQQGVLCALQERLPVEMQEEDDDRTEEFSVLLALSADAREGPREVLQQHQQGHTQLAGQLQPERLADQEFQQHVPQQQNAETRERCQGETQEHQIASKDSVWYSPIGIGASPDLFAFLRGPAAAAAVLCAAEQTTDKLVIARDAATVEEWDGAQTLDGVKIDDAIARADADSQQRLAAPVVKSSSYCTILSSTQRGIVQEEKEQEEHKKEGQAEKRSFKTQANEKDCDQQEQDRGARQQREAAEGICTSAFTATKPACVATTELSAAASDAAVNDDATANPEDTNVLEHSSRQDRQVDSFRQNEDVCEAATCGGRAQQQRVSERQQQMNSEQRREVLGQENTPKQLRETEQVEMQTVEHQRHGLHWKEHQQEQQQQVNNDDAATEKSEHTCQQERHQQEDELQERDTLDVEREVETIELQQMWTHVLETGEYEKKVHQQQVKHVCSQLGDCDVVVVKRQHDEEARITHEQSDRGEAGVNDLAQQQRPRPGQCDQVQQERCMLQNEEVGQRQQIRDEWTEELARQSSVDPEVELSPSLSSISLPGCSSVHDRSPAARDAEVTFSLCDGTRDVGDAVETHHAVSPRDIAPNVSLSPCKQVSSQTHAEVTPEEAPKRFPEEDLPAGVWYPAITGTAEKVATPSSTPLELVLQQSRRNLRPVQQVQNKFQQSQSQQPYPQQEFIQQDLQPPPQQQSQHRGIYQKQQLQQHQQNAEKLHTQKWEEQRDQKLQRAQQCQQQQQVQVPPQVPHVQQQQLQRQQVQQADQELQQGEDLRATTAENSERVSDSRQQETFGPRVALSCRAPTVNPELLSPVEAAAGGPCVSTSLPTVVSHVATAGRAGCSISAVLASRSTPAAPSPCALPPAPKQRQQRQQQGQQEQTQKIDSFQPHLPAQNFSLQKQRQQSSARTGYRSSPFEASIAETRGDCCSSLRRYGSPITTSSTVAFHTAGRGDTAASITYTCKQMQKQRRSGYRVLMADCPPLQTSSLKQLETAERSLQPLSSSHELSRQKGGTSQQKAAEIEVSLPYEEAMVNIASKSLGGKTVTRGEVATKNAVAPSAPGATENERVSAIAVPTTVNQENATALVPVAVPTEMVATATVEPTTGRTERNASRDSLFRAEALPKASAVSAARGETSKAAAGETAFKAASSTSVAGKDTLMGRDASARTIVYETKSCLSDPRSDLGPSAEDAQAGVEGKKTGETCSQDRRRSVSVSVKEDSQKLSVAGGSPSVIERRRRRHSLGAVVLRLSSKYRQTIAMNKNSSERSNRKNNGSGFDVSGSSSSNTTEKDDIKIKSASHSCSTGDTFDSQHQQVASTMEEYVNAERSNQRRTTVPPRQLPGGAEPHVLAQRQTAGATAVGAEDVRKEAEGAALPNSRVCRTASSKKREKAKHSGRKDSSSREEEKAATSTEILPAAHAPPASIQPRLSYSFFKSHAQHQRQQQDQQQKDQQEQLQPQQGQQTQHRRSLRHLLSSRRKSFSGSDTSAAEVTILCQPPAGALGSAKSQTVISSKPGVTVAEPLTVSSLRFLNRRFSTSSSSTVGADSAPRPMAAASVPPAVSTSTGSSLPVVMGCVSSPSVAPVSSNIPLAVHPLASSDSSSSEGIHLKGVVKESNGAHQSTDVSARTDAAVFPEASSCAQAEVAAGVFTIATSASTAALTTNRRPSPALMRRAVSAFRTGAVTCPSSSSSGPSLLTASSTSSTAVMSFAAAAAAARSAAAAAAFTCSATAASESKAFWQSQQQFSRTTEPDTSRTEWGAGSSSNGSSNNSLANDSQTQGRPSEPKTHSSNIVSKNSSGDHCTLGKKLPRFFGLHLTLHASQQRPKPQQHQSICSSRAAK